MSIAAYTIADNLKTTDLKPEESKPRKRNHQRAGETEDLSPSSWQLSSYCGAHISTLASVASATSATEVITSTHRIATHQQNVYKQSSHHQTAIVEEHSVTHLNSSASSLNHSQQRKRKAADGGYQSSKSSHSNSTASNISSGATISSSNSVYHQKTSTNSLKMTAGHKGSGQKVINKVNTKT